MNCKRSISYFFRSKANDLALRLARDYTKHKDAIVIEHAFHGHVTTTMELSPYKFDIGFSTRLGPRGTMSRCKLYAAGKQYSDDVKSILDDVESKKRGVAAYFAEALQSCGGQVIPPKDYFKDVAAHVRNHGGLMVIDEVQTGFGRIGRKYWAHQLYDDGFVPDIVTMGKPMGNGFPVSAVATRKEIADALGGEVGYFNTVCFESV
ncbi:hypothetical protein B9Z55_015307 [Caenorhabditis nigoni]|uniref:Uncharacterized protein n=1 Tax=Caenorhabditis nigoni TaxID=1611254 RepID=A0A2G5U9N6_9PELO|nr:hypothetical protein B9Z55_015307 [Caenorhabditis nigoni]